jgi:hypothetical protein
VLMMGVVCTHVWCVRQRETGGADDGVWCVGLLHEYMNTRAALLLYSCCINAVLVQRELEAKMMRSGLNVVWKMGKLLLEERVRRVCEIMMSAVDRCRGGGGRHATGDAWMDGCMLELEADTSQEMYAWMDGWMYVPKRGGHKTGHVWMGISIYGRYMHGSTPWIGREEVVAREQGGSSEPKLAV